MSNNDKFDNFLNELMDSLKMVNLSIVIVEENKIIYEKNFGFSFLETENKLGKKLKAGDLFRIGSISKTFIATAILKLIEEGQLNLEDDAQNYLNFPLRNPLYPQTPITIDMLLTHTSSIYDSLKYKSGIYYPLEIINPIKNHNFSQTYLSYEPGRKYKYSNLNFVLLGAIIENLTNKRLDNFIEEKILLPLSIEGSFNSNKLDTTKYVHNYIYNKEFNYYREIKDAYNNYEEEFKIYTLGESTSILNPAAALKISSHDLARFMIMHMNMGKIDNITFLSPKSEEIMRTDYKNIKNNYGHTISKYNNIIENKTLLGQTGGSLGLKSCMLFDPESKIGFIIICSGSLADSPNGMKEIHKPIIQKYFSEFYN